MTTTIDAAREDARRKTGEFGTQTHADPGLVTAPSFFDEAFVIDLYEVAGNNVGRFEGFKGGQFRTEVTTMVRAMNTASRSTGVDSTLNVTFARDELDMRLKNLVSVSDPASTLWAVDMAEDDELTADTEATGRSAAEAIVMALIGHRFRLQARMDRAYAALSSTDQEN